MAAAGVDVSEEEPCALQFQGCSHLLLTPFRAGITNDTEQGGL